MVALHIRLYLNVTNPVLHSGGARALGEGHSFTAGSKLDRRVSQCRYVTLVVCQKSTQSKEPKLVARDAEHMLQARAKVQKQKCHGTPLEGDYILMSK